MKLRTPLLALALAAAPLAAAGCGSDDAADQAKSAADKAKSVASDVRSQAESVATEARSAAEKATGGGGGGGGEVKVSMKDILYKPAVATVKVGQKVVWSNDDPVAHTVTAKDGQFDSGTVQPGKSFSYTPDKAGTIPYVCQIHPNQKGTLAVRG